MRATSRGAVLLTVVFAVGLLAGVALDRSLSRRGPTGTRIMKGTPDVLDKLGLTADQRHTADSILEQSSPRSEALMREMVPRLAAIADSVNVELRLILTPEQRLKLDSLTRGPVFVLKHKDSAGGSRVDTIRNK